MNNLGVTVASGDTFEVRDFSVGEPMSAYFSVSLLVVSRSHDVDFDQIMGQDASFAVAREGGARRVWRGICSAAQQVADEESGLSTYSLTLVPRLWLLSQRRNYRIFQQKSELDIALAVLRDWDIEPKLRLKSTYKKRKYRVQYAESDYDFMRRMLEDAGISFYFEPGETTHDLVLDDAPQSNERRAEPLRYADAPNAGAQSEFATNVLLQRSVRPGRVTLRDHDYRQRPDYNLAASSGGGLAAEQRLEQFHYVPGAFLYGASSDGGEASAADDKGRTRVDEQEAARLAERRLAAERAQGNRVTFSSNATDLRPGMVLTLGGHPRAELGDDKPLLVVNMMFSGSSDGEWFVRAQAVSASVSYHPPLESVRPTITGVESATVVGPRGEEIHTDEFGRVRVHFHWDRESQMDDNSSCWIHVSQSWSGSGFGGTMLPRVGQEVLVDFIGGDPDRPVITGRVYTNLQKTPFALPANKTQSGFRSASTGGGGGYNELMMDDKQGQELLRMQAERDYTFLVRNDWSTTVGHDRADVTRANHTETVDGRQAVDVHGDRSVVVHANQSHAVLANIANVAVGGTATHVSRGPTVVSSEESVLLMVGPSSFILIERDKITLQSGSVVING